jgi:hypothetical protein
MAAVVEALNEPRVAGSNDHDSAKAVAVTPASPRVFLSQDEDNELDGFLGTLARLYRLHTYGKSLLTRPAAFELRFVAAMLSIIFLFDFAAWTLFWNMIFYGGRIALGLYTPLAMLFAFLIATMVVLYERGFMVSDLSRMFRSFGATLKLGAAILLRILVIAVSAYVTAQPVEIVAFGGDIQNRIHDESILREAVSRLRDLQKAEADSHGATGLEGTVEKAGLDKAETLLSNARGEEGTIRAALEIAKRGEQAAAAGLQRAQAAYGSARDKGAAARRISAARSRLENARREVTDAEGRLQAFKVTVAGAVDEKTSAEAKVIDLQAHGKKAAERVRNWLVQLKNELAGSELKTENNGGPDKFTFRDREYDFFQRQSVIDDLYYGRPPRWKDASESDKIEIIKNFGFGESQEESQRRVIEAHTFAKSYWAVFLVAFILPLLVLAYKLLFPKDLSNYYSREMQSGKFLNDLGRI